MFRFNYIFLFIGLGLVITLFHFRNQINTIYQYKQAFELFSDSSVLNAMLTKSVATPSELSEYEYIRKVLAGLDCTITGMDTYIDVKARDEEVKLYKGNIDANIGNATIESPFGKIVIVKDGKESTIDFWDLIDKQIEYGNN